MVLRELSRGLSRLSPVETLQRSFSIFALIIHYDNSRVTMADTFDRFESDHIAVW
jgi:hypothetical protein